MQVDSWVKIRKGTCKSTGLAIKRTLLKNWIRVNGRAQALLMTKMIGHTFSFSFIALLGVLWEKQKTSLPTVSTTVSTPENNKKKKLYMNMRLLLTVKCIHNNSATASLGLVWGIPISQLLLQILTFRSWSLLLFCL